MNLAVVSLLMRVGVSLKKVHELIEHMAIKVLSKEKFWTLMRLVEVCVLLSVSLQGITCSMLQATWDFNEAL